MPHQHFNWKKKKKKTQIYISNFFFLTNQTYTNTYKKKKKIPDQTQTQISSAITNTFQTLPCPISAHNTIPKTPIPPKAKISKCAQPCLPLYSYSFPLTTIPPLCYYYDDSYIMGRPLQLIQILKNEISWKFPTSPLEYHAMSNFS